MKDIWYSSSLSPIEPLRLSGVYFTDPIREYNNVFTTDEPVTLVNNGTTNTQMYSMSLMVLIALLSLLITFLLYWIFVLLIQPLMRKSNTCRYLFPCYR